MLACICMILFVVTASGIEPCFYQNFENRCKSHLIDEVKCGRVQRMRSTTEMFHIKMMEDNFFISNIIFLIIFILFNVIISKIFFI